MRRLYIGIGLIAALLAASLFTQWGMAALHMPVSDALEQAAEAALREDWEAADALAGKARQSWEKSRRLTAAVADHNPMDQVDMLYAEMAVYGQQRDAEHFAAACAQLARMTRAIAEAHKSNWGNLL